MTTTSTELLGLKENGIVSNKPAKSLVLSHIRQYPDGTTISEIAKSTELPFHRVRAIITDLENEREIYSRKIRGVRSRLFYPNGKLIHQYLQRTQEFGSQIFRISLHEGRNNPMLQIQERSFSLMEGEKVEGSIFISHNHAPEFIEFLKRMLDDFENFRR